MKNLAMDRDEVDSSELKNWVARKRNAQGIKAAEPSTWFAYIEGNPEDPAWWVIMQRSPGDALAEAEAYARGVYGEPRGIGRWLLEVYGDGENAPKYLVVRPCLDEYAGD